MTRFEELYGNANITTAPRPGGGIDIRDATTGQLFGTGVDLRAARADAVVSAEAGLDTPVGVNEADAKAQVDAAFPPGTVVHVEGDAPGTIPEGVPGLQPGQPMTATEVLGGRTNAPVPDPTVPATQVETALIARGQAGEAPGAKLAMGDPLVPPAGQPPVLPPYDDGEVCIDEFRGDDLTIDELSDDVSQLERDNGLLRVSAEVSRSTIDGMQKELETREAELETLGVALATLSDKLEEQNEALTNQTRVIKQQTAIIDGYEKAKELADATGLVRQLKMQVHDLTKQNELARAERDDHAHNMVDAVRELGELRKVVNEHQSQHGSVDNLVMPKSPLEAHDEV